MEVVLQIEGLDHEAQGIARHEGKVVFVDGALPGETVRAEIKRRRSHFDQAELRAVLVPGPSRTEPRCPHFGHCGGCNMQHADPAAQIAYKQRILEDNLARIGKVRPDALWAPVQGPDWGYRQRARLSVRWLAKKGRMLVGFHEKRSSFVADMDTCAILPPAVSTLLVPLRNLILELTVRERLPQIEVAQSKGLLVLVLRLLELPTEEDKVKMRAFADRHGVQLWWQTRGPDTARPFYPLERPGLVYHLDEFDVEIPFGPTEFTQVNSAVNRVLVGKAVRLLDPRPEERVLDLFCGLGNFTLALARRGAQVLGIEGNPALVDRACQNAAHNGLEKKTRFQTTNLFEVDESTVTGWGRQDKWLIDPPRDGAINLVKAIGTEGPRRIVYVSCSPATLARDAGVLVHRHGYRLKGAGVFNMFPHTAHVESLTLFERE
ncbi:23S rRNA (uracil(1939)-C(5))-methyltransferase RlmD [Ferrovum sp.]|uniref:23S rRNA (uracil(1939)-C(5))-methyltransferase RlmD n=1 Tax=Ferrovum sp. TaxID=2609467 RepID=UPI002609A727|nr:23S rRNA (uracil(1939)-C(5))-methyltransferase RlmD [Ferrovum sp.]